MDHTGPGCFLKLATEIGVCSNTGLSRPFKTIHPRYGCQWVWHWNRVIKDQTNAAECVVDYASPGLKQARTQLLSRGVTYWHSCICPTFLTIFTGLRTDHGSLRRLQNFKGQLAQWLEKFQEYHFTIDHRCGKWYENGYALRVFLAISAEGSLIRIWTSTRWQSFMQSSAAEQWVAGMAAWRCLV